MTPLKLLQTLQKSLQSATQNFKYGAQHQDAKKISVYLGRLPAQNFETDNFYPMVLVELFGVDEDVEESIAQVLISIWTYAGLENEGYIELLNISENIRKFLLENKILDGEFLLQLPLSFGVAETDSDNFICGNFLVEYRGFVYDNNYLEV